MTNKTNVVIKLTPPQSCGRQNMRNIGAAHTLYPALQTCGMTKCVSRGFTLIELLVVVLIIAILAAIALPQYRLAVIKAHIGSILPLVSTVAKADSLYYLSHGVYSPNVENLDIALPKECSKLSGQGIPNGQVWQCGSHWVLDNSSGTYVMAYYCPTYNSTYGECYANSAFKIVNSINYANTNQNKTYCHVQNNSSLGKKVCKSLSIIECLNC